MAARLRPSAASHTLPVTADPDGAPGVWRPPQPASRFVFPFNVPATPEALAIRIMKNAGHFGMFYVLLMWVGLSIALLVDRSTRGSISILLWMTAVTNSFLVLLRLMPHPIFMHRAMDKALVLFGLGAVTVVGLVMTDAGIHMLITIAIGLPVVLVHAALWRDDLRPVNGNGSAVIEEEMSEVSEFTIALVDGPRSDEVVA
ncbi:hypothetical protein MLD38_020922 [Melastoma candidum]|uniref:Uncharacterized protein n=1 Tax=Melastoma candidum TaxID=119954 RepID=A0ACB9QES1_9MYRT|nr:hypothetical protein MLD38_020922 [Melastoma candidum]